MLVFACLEDLDWSRPIFLAALRPHNRLRRDAVFSKMQIINKKR